MAGSSIFPGYCGRSVREAGSDGIFRYFVFGNDRNPGRKNGPVKGGGTGISGDF